MEPITIDGKDVVYSTEKQEAVASGNVVVVHKSTKLTCQKLTINTATKEAVAEGDARLEDEQGIIEGKKIIYNFGEKKGLIIDSEFRSNPYFGRARSLEKISDDEFVVRRGYLTTCAYDIPHYRIKSRRMNFFPGDKIQTKDDTFYAGNIPVMYLPQYNHSLKDPLMHVQLLPGSSKDWGPFLLTAWRYNLTEDLRGRIYLDYRNKLGLAEGFGTNYTSSEFGKGDFKFYYTHEEDKDSDIAQDVTRSNEFQRYLIRWRHKWDIDLQTNLTAEYYRIEDSKRALLGNEYNFLKDYFYREYEKDSQPLSYVFLHRSFDYSSLDFLLQKRTNRWFTQEEKLPEIKYTLPSQRIGDSPFYFENNSTYLNENFKQAVPSSSEKDNSYNNFITFNKLSLPTKAAFVNLNPFFSGQENYNDKGKYGATSIVDFNVGSEVSTKFYRLFNVKTNAFGLDINNLRHVITPNAVYTVGKTSTMPAGKARFGGGATTGSSSVSLGLSNKLQTKRNNMSLDLVDLNVTSSYQIKPKTGEKRGSSLQDVLFELKLLPYSWMRVDADATYKHTDKYKTGYNRFSDVNYDVAFDLGKGRSFAFGQRYLRKGGNELTFDLDWRLHPKWSFSIYQRRNIGHDPTLKRGIREQEYTVSRDLHCWIMDVTYNVKAGQGESIWVAFRLKAFPELEFEFNQSYHAPKPGSQSNP